MIGFRVCSGRQNWQEGSAKEDSSELFSKLKDALDSYNWLIKNAKNTRLIKGSDTWYHADAVYVEMYAESDEGEEKPMYITTIDYTGEVYEGISDF